MHESTPHFLQTPELTAEAEAAQWRQVVHYAEQHAFIEAMLRCTTGLATESVRMMATLAQRIEHPPLLDRAYETAHEVVSPVEAADVWSTLYEVTQHAEAANAARTALYASRPTAQAPRYQVNGPLQNVAERLGDVDLAHTIPDPTFRMRTLLHIATQPGADKHAYESARIEAQRQHDWASLARLARTHGGAEMVDSTKLSRETVYPWLDLAIAAHKDGARSIVQATLRTIDGIQLSHQGKLSLIPIVKALIAEEGLDFLANIHKSPVLRANALLHLPPTQFSPGRVRHIRRLIKQQSAARITQAAAAVHLVERTQSAKDSALAHDLLVRTPVGEHDAAVQSLRERLAIVDNDFYTLSKVAQKKTLPQGMAAIAHKTADHDLMDAARFAARGIENPLDRAKALTSVALIAHDYGLAAEAMDLAHKHNRDAALQLALHSIVSPLPNAIDASKFTRVVHEVTTPQHDNADTRHRMAALGALSVYAGPAILQSHMTNAPTVAMADYALGAATKAAHHGALMSDGRAIARTARQRLESHVANGTGSAVGTGVIAEALIVNQDAAALGMLYERGVPDTPTERRIARLLLNARSYRTMRDTEMAIFDDQQPSKLRKALLDELATVYGDAEIAQVSARTGLRNDALLAVAGYVRKQYGATLDSQTLSWLLCDGTVRTTKTAEPLRHATAADACAAIDTFYRVTREVFLQMQDEGSPHELATRLGYQRLRTIYFMHAIDRTQYPWSPAYTPRRFSRFLAGIERYEVDAAQFALFRQAVHIPDKAKDALWRGEPIVAQPTWDIYPQSASPGLESRLRDFCADLGTHIAVGGPISPEDQAETVAAAIEPLLGIEFAGLVRATQSPPNVALLLQELGAAAPALAYRITQHRNMLRRTAAPQDELRAWTAFAATVRSLPLPYIPGAAVGFLRKDPNYAQQPALQDMAQRFGRILGPLTEIARTRMPALRARMLHKRNDLMEYSRFADVTGNCFSTISFEQSYSSREAFFDRVWKDPCSFAIQIEASTTARQAVGFVFGTVGIFNARTALFLNGVYLQKQDTAAARAVIESIRRNVAEPLGISVMAFAAHNGGTFSPGNDYLLASGHPVTRYSALRSDDALVRRTFDDVGLMVNGPPENGHKHLWYQAW